MSTAARLTVAVAAQIMREAEAVRDKSYRQFFIGQEWGRFLRAKRLAGCAENTLLSYETVGRLFTLRYADFTSLEPFAASETGPSLCSTSSTATSTAAAQALLRHKSVATTETYLHAGVDDLRRTIEQLSSSSAHGQEDS